MGYQDVGTTRRDSFPREMFGQQKEEHETGAGRGDGPEREEGATENDTNRSGG